MRRRRLVFLCAVLLPLAAPRAADAPVGALSLTGKVAHPQQFNLDRLKALASQRVQVSFLSERGEQKMGFTGVPL